MDKKHTDVSGGFLLGFLVGVISALLLTTKKGRKILRKLTERGLDKLGDLEDVVQHARLTEETFIDGDDYLVSEPASDIPAHGDTIANKSAAITHEVQPHKIRQTAQSTVKPDAESSETRMKSTARRFFRGAKKKAAS